MKIIEYPGRPPEPEKKPAFKLSYEFVGCLVALIIFPFFTLFPTLFFLGMFWMGGRDAGNSMFDVCIWLFASSITGLYFGRRLAKRSDLPGSFARRYWPLLTPAALILILNIYDIAFGKIAPDSEAEEFIAWMVLCFAPLVGSFALFVPREKKLSDTRWRWQTCAFFAVNFVILGCQAHFNPTFVLGISFSGATVSDESIIEPYWPWSGADRLASLDKPASLLLRGDYPVLDGATAFVPLYSATANEIYRVVSKDELQEYMACSTTPGAYDRLIRGEADVIFVFQPSDEQRAAAKSADKELALTPIAREAFVFFVNGGNPVSGLSTGQIQDIYRKKITNWREVGGNDIKILPFQRPEDSGSQTAMLKEVMKDKELPLPIEAEYYGTMGGVYRAVAQYRDQAEAIGYSFRFFAQVMVQYESHPADYPRRKRFRPVDAEPVKFLAVDGVAPTVENIRNGTYPFTQDVYAVTAGTKNPHAKELIAWLLSPQGQELIERTGYVALPGDSQ